MNDSGNDFPFTLITFINSKQTAAGWQYFVQRNPHNLAIRCDTGFSQPNVQTSKGNQSRFIKENNFHSNQNRGNNFNQTFQNQSRQFSNHQPINTGLPSSSIFKALRLPQIQGVSKTDFENYVKANDAVLKNVQNQANNAITTRSGKTLEGPSTPLVPTPVVSNPQKEPEQNPETSTEKVQNPNLENTAHVPPPEEEESIFMEIPKPKAKKTVNVEIQEPNSPRPNSYQSKLPYPERMKVRENDKPSAQHSRFLKMFKQLRLEIGLKDALVEMPKFNKWLSSLLRNKEKLEEIAITTVNAECSAIIMNKVPEKLEDPGKFLIPCALQELDSNLGYEALTPTRMTLELANCSITHPMGIAEDVVVRVDGFTFLADFVVGYLNLDPRFLSMIRLDAVPTTHYDAPSPSALSLVKTSDTLEEFTMNSLFLKKMSDPLHHEFVGELLTLPSRNDREFGEYLSLMTVLCEISTSQSQENVHANRVRYRVLFRISYPLLRIVSRSKEIDIFLVPDDLIPQVRIYQKSQENRQKRANTDTRTEECARAGSQSQEKSTFSQNWSNLGQLSKSTLEDKNPKVSFQSLKISKSKEAQEKMGFALIALTKEAHMSLSRIAKAGQSMWINCDPRAIINPPIIKRMYGHDLEERVEQAKG
ncbi:hypothetical protein Tco_1186208 [Tanacetum coccineum]